MQHFQSMKSTQTTGNLIDDDAYLLQCRFGIVP